jgi:hypothetical protein
MTGGEREGITTKKMRKTTIAILLQEEDTMNIPRTNRQDRSERDGI